jgi:hypothetical protein
MNECGFFHMLHRTNTGDINFKLYKHKILHRASRGTTRMNITLTFQTDNTVLFHKFQSIFV